MVDYIKYNAIVKFTEVDYYGHVREYLYFQKIYTEVFRGEGL